MKADEAWDAYKKAGRDWAEACRKTARAAATYHKAKSAESDALEDYNRAFGAWQDAYGAEP